MLMIAKTSIPMDNDLTVLYIQVIFKPVRTLLYLSDHGGNINTPLTVCLLVSSADNILMVFLKFFKKVNFEKKSADDKKA